MKKVIAYPAPKTLNKHAANLGIIAAVIMAVMVVLQIVGIHKTVSGLESSLGLGSTVAITVTVVALMAEIFSIPFLLRLKLSKLARLVSGILAVVAPWIWVLVTVFTVEMDLVMAQLGMIDSLKVTWWVLAANGVWLIFNFYVARQLNINKAWYEATGLKPRAELKKTKK